MLKSKKIILLLSALNALLMTAFTFLWVNNSYILTDDEEYMIKLTSGVKNTLLKWKKKPDPNEFLFVDIAWEKQLLNEKNADGQVIGKRPITNRKRIAELLSYINKSNQHKFILLDVFFKDSSDYSSDSTLQIHLSKTKNILIPYHLNEEGQADNPIFKTPIALSDYEKDDVDNNFIKYKAIHQDSLRTTPLVMYEKLHGKKFVNHSLYGLMDKRLALSSFILDLRIWAPNLSYSQILSEGDSSGQRSYQILYLSDLLCDALNPALSKSEANLSEEEKAMALASRSCAEEQISNLTKDRIIVIGDFSDGDIHETIYGATPGPLILTNVYLALREGDNLFSFWFVLFLFSGFYFISYNCFVGKDLFVAYLNKLSKKIKQFNRSSFFLNFMSYILYFILLSVLSFFLFNIHITILLLALYMEVLEKILDYLRKRTLQPEKENIVKTS